MTQTILDHTDYNHQLLLMQWDDAVVAHNALLDWREANPCIVFDNDRPPDERQAWWAAERKVEQSLGLNTDLGSDAYAKGRIQLNRRFGAHVLLLRRLTRDIDDKPTIGDRIVQCPHCSTLFATFSQHDHYCTDACSDAAQAQRSEAKVERRKGLQTKRSEALANRTGICLSCGNAFTIKRSTAKTCSETCRKRLQRKPELAEQYLQLPPVRTDLAELEAAHTSNCQAALSGNRKEHDDLGTLRIIWQQRCYQRLHSIAAQAPALTAWLASQGDDMILAAFSPEYGQMILGPDLWKSLGLDCYTDASVSWRLKYRQSA